MPPVMDWDNHAAHLRGHEKWMKSKQFQLASDEIQQRFRVHWEAHKDAMTRLALQDAQKQAALQAAMAPAPPSGPTGPGGPVPPDDAVVGEPGGAAVSSDSDGPIAGAPGAPSAPPVG
jgi:hypothetical protein